MFIFRDVEPGAYVVYAVPTLAFFSFPTGGHAVEVAAGVLSVVNFGGTAATSRLGVGKPVTGLSGTARSIKWFALPITASDGTSGTVEVTLFGGTGDADLVVVDPNGSQSFSSGDTNTELVRQDAVTGEWHVLLLGFADFAGVTLTAVQR